jgi:acyl-coenzyme A synthetase/AMP-(fatty) acid ligase
LGVGVQRTAISSALGSAIFIKDARGKFNALPTLEMLNKYPITTLCAPPTAYRMLVLDEPMA